MHPIARSSLSLLALVPVAHAWGNLGHQTVGFIAQNFVSDKTVTWAQGMLGNSSDAYLAYVATWADQYRRTSGGTFSAPFHFIDANDKPPTSCGVDFDRDCGDTGCVVSAIQNYTIRVQDGRLSEENQKEALKFLVHFLGDITQPLHDEATETGGNDIDVTFDGDSTNLHSIWDTAMLEKLVGGYSLDDAQSWAQNLTNEIKSGDYKSDAPGWIEGMSLDDVQGSAMTWATDANKFVCSAVLKGGESAVEKGDLGGAYYEANIPIFTEQIAKGGYRLAAWLNLIATGDTGL